MRLPNTESLQIIKCNRILQVIRGWCLSTSYINLHSWLLTFYYFRMLALSVGAQSLNELCAWSAIKWMQREEVESVNGNNSSPILSTDWDQFFLLGVHTRNCGETLILNGLARKMFQIKVSKLTNNFLWLRFFLRNW